MTPNEVTDILRKFARTCRADENLWGTSLPGVPTEVGAAVESAIEMIERIEAAEKSETHHTQPTQPAPFIPEGWEKELFCIQHAMAMNNWNWESDASNDMKRAAYAAVVKLRAAAPEAKP